MNYLQVFNPRRFALLARREILFNWKKLILDYLSIIVLIAFFCSTAINFLYTSPEVYYLNQAGESMLKPHVYKDFSRIAIILYLIFIVIHVGWAFPDFRSKERTQNFILLPNSVFEKWVFEFILRIVVFSILYVFLLTIGMNIGQYVYSIFASQEVTFLNFWFPFEALSYSFSIDVYGEPNIYILSLVAGIALSSIMLTGASFFQKYPIIKSVASIYIFQTVLGLATVLIGLLFYSRFDHLMRNLGADITWEAIGIKWIVYGFLIFTFIVFHTATYFQLKEKSC
ncbi:MAG: hypothetical protein ACEPOW_04210 [Bacteroidales bacterium]